MIGLLAPEIIAFTAWGQRKEARRFTKEIQEIWDQHSPVKSARASGTSEPDIELGLNEAAENQFPEQYERDNNSCTPNATEPGTTGHGPESDAVNPPRKHQWTATHSFFVISGGFAFDTSSLPEDQKFLPGSRDRVTLNPNAVLLLAKYHPSLVPDISEAAIKDKSKASPLAKTIVCLQAIWFVIQCLFRLGQGLAISLLELNTFAHALCALLIYLLWWDKPSDVEEPAIIDDPSAYGICALLSCRGTFDGICDGNRLIFHDRSPGRSQDEMESSEEIERVRILAHLRPQEAAELIDGQYIPGTAIQGRIGWGPHKNDKPHSRYYPNDWRRWRLAHFAWESHGPEFRSDFDKIYDNVNLNCQVNDRIWNLPVNGGRWQNIVGSFSGLPVTETETEIEMLLAFAFAGLIYGGLHLLAWNSPFTSYAQRILWRVSAIGISASFIAPLVLRLLLFTTLALRFLLVPKGLVEVVMGTPWKLFLAAFIPLFFLYLVARVYLVVECFISFAYLPEDVFKQPTWTYYFPHIG